MRGNSDCLTWVKHSSCKNSATHSYQCVKYFRVSKQWCGCQCWGFFYMCTDVDACVCTQGLFRHRKRVCTGRWLWEKNSLPHRGLEPTSVLCLAFQSDTLPAELSPPLTSCAKLCNYGQVQPLQLWHRHKNRQNFVMDPHPVSTPFCAGIHTILGVDPHLQGKLSESDRPLLGV